MAKRAPIEEVIRRLSAEDQRAVADFAEYLLHRRRMEGNIWERLAALDPDDEPLSEEEKRQLLAPDEYISLEDVKRELGL
ncbi:MAG: hypothetical protein ACYCVB_01080 [Bacilli bacterium]